MLQVPQLYSAFEPDTFPKRIFRNLAFVLIIALAYTVFASSTFAQTYNRYQNGSSNQNTFRQEIARLDITVERSGSVPLPIKMVPRTQRGDIIRVRMLDQPVNGIRPDKSLWDWTIVIAFVNPSRNEKSSEAVSREVNFQREGWYREHAFKVPFDSQPIFFLYPRQNYRKKIQKLITRNFNDLRKIGEKTLEISSAYAQIGTFLNQLQDVIRRNPRVYSNNTRYPSYGGFYGDSDPRENFMREQFVERLAQSFNIALPNCWRNRVGSSYGSNYSYRGVQNYSSNDFVSRAQCVAKNVRLEDFDLSVSKILTGGGLLAATDLAKKFPELAHWINIAAIAADLILRITRKTPLKILPTMTFSGNSNLGSYNNRNYTQNSNGLNNYNQNKYNQGNGNQTYQRARSSLVPSQPISIVSNAPPTDSSYVSAFPIVLHKWQSQPDPELITLPIPRLLEPCLHIGRNILKNTDLSYDWLRDPFARDFRLIVSSENGFTKEFRLYKNLGMSGWDLQITPQDIAAFPKIKMTLYGQVVATRGFNSIKSKKFEIPIPGGGNWAVKDESKSAFSVGGKRRIIITNTNGNCLCLRTIVYKPSFGGEFVFAAGADANPVRISEDGSHAWFNMDTKEFKPGDGKFEVFSYGSLTPQIIKVNLYGPPPEITKFRIHKGDRYLFVEGKSIDQIESIKIDGKSAKHDKDLQLSYPKNIKIFVFENPLDMILSNSLSIEMNLTGNRTYKYPTKFPVLPARPTITANDRGEIEGDILNRALTGRQTKFDLGKYSVASVETENMTVAVRTSLTDYNFKAENISIETRIENGRVGQKELPQATFEVIDTFNMRIGFKFDPQYRQFLAGRRLQFRIRDRERGLSDWYTIRQTFIRIPSIRSVNCQRGQCRILGKGLDYIGQYSTDGGKTWNPPLQAKANPKGEFTLIVPDIKERKDLRIKLRDFPKTVGLRP